MSVLAIIPARGGSKGIPQKNAKRLGEHPLLAYTARVVASCPEVTRAVLSTDSEVLAEIGLANGLEVPGLRPATLASDIAPMHAVIEHVLANWVEGKDMPETVVLLQPTSPFRRAETIREAIALLASSGADSVVSVSEIPQKYSPYFLMQEMPTGELDFFFDSSTIPGRRQDAPKAYSRNGVVYAFKTKSFIENQSLYGKHCLPLITAPNESVNLDDAEDWDRAETLLQQGAVPWVNQPRSQKP